MQRATYAALLAGALLATTGGCFLLPAGDGVPSSTPTDSSATSSETPTETPTPEPVALTCESVIDQATLDEWAGFGVINNPDFAAKMHDEGNAPFSLFDDNGGIICQWGFGNGAATTIYGYSQLSYDELIDQQNRLGGLGASVSAYGGGAVANLYTIEFGENVDGGPEYYLFSGDLSDQDDLWWMYAYTTEILDQMVSNIPDL